MSAVLYSMIHKAAENQPPRPIEYGESNTGYCFKVWGPHWIATARRIANEMHSQGLFETAKEIHKIANEQEKFL